MSTRTVGGNNAQRYKPDIACVDGTICTLARSGIAGCMEPKPHHNNIKHLSPYSTHHHQSINPSRSSVPSTRLYATLSAFSTRFKYIAKFLGFDSIYYTTLAICTYTVLKNVEEVTGRVDLVDHHVCDCCKSR